MRKLTMKLIVTLFLFLTSAFAFGGEKPQYKLEGRWSLNGIDLELVQDFGACGPMIFGFGNLDEFTIQGQNITGNGIVREDGSILIHWDIWSEYGDSHRSYGIYRVTIGGLQGFRAHAIKDGKLIGPKISETIGPRF